MVLPFCILNDGDYLNIFLDKWAHHSAIQTTYSIVLPVSVFAFFVRKSIVQGLTMGALKD
jgi:hypothetical protein